MQIRNLNKKEHKPKYDNENIEFPYGFLLKAIFAENKGLKESFSVFPNDKYPIYLQDLLSFIKKEFNITRK